MIVLSSNMESFQEEFKCCSQHLHADTVSSVLQSFHQYNDAIRPFKGKNKIAVVSQSQFTRNHLADAAFSLKEVCETLLGVVLNITNVPVQTNQASIINEVSSKMEESLSKLMKEFEKKV